MANKKVRTGGCQCGELRYEISELPTALYCCHCNECQAQSGSAFGMSLIVPASGFKLTQGEPKNWRRPASINGWMNCYFCPTCGGRVYHQVDGDDNDEISVKAGTLDERADLQPTAHLWTSRSHSWVRPPEGQVRFPEEPLDRDSELHFAGAEQFFESDQ